MKISSNPILPPNTYSPPQLLHQRTDVGASLIHEEQSEPLKQLTACQGEAVDELVRLGVDQFISSKHKWQQLIEPGQTIFVH